MKGIKLRQLILNILLASSLLSWPAPDNFRSIGPAYSSSFCAITCGPCAERHINTSGVATGNTSDLAHFQPDSPLEHVQALDP